MSAMTVNQMDLALRRAFIAMLKLKVKRLEKDLAEAKEKLREMEEKA